MSNLQWDRSFALEQVDNNLDLLTELLDLLNETARADLDKIKKGAESGDAQSIGDCAHSIKGASANLGFEGLRNLAYALEKAGRNGDLKKAKSLIPELEEMLTKLYNLQ